MSTSPNDIVDQRECVMSQAATKPTTIGAYQRRRPSDETARAGKLQVLLLMGSGVVASAQIGKAIISVPIIRSDLALGLDLAGLIVATFATIGATTGIAAGLVVSRLGAGAVLDWRNGRHLARQCDRRQCARSTCSTRGAHY
jgi:hypothetical protein